MKLVLTKSNVQNRGASAPTIRLRFAISYGVFQPMPEGNPSVPKVPSYRPEENTLNTVPLVGAYPFARLAVKLPVRAMFPA